MSINITRAPATLPGNRNCPVGNSLLFSGRKLKKPPALKPGDTIAIVAPATTVPHEELRRDIQTLQKKGFKVLNYVRTDTYGKHYLSDTDKKRAKAINQAFQNPQVKAVFSINGGAGSFRPDFLKYLNWKTIRKHPKIVTGFSDITFLHLALQKEAGIVSFHSGFPRSPAVRNKRNVTKALWALMAPDNPDKTPPPIEADTMKNRRRPYSCLVPGEATGRLIGGNLSILTSSFGTPYQPDFSGKILFLEDWGLFYEDVDRLFSQLMNSGSLDKINGLIFGEFPYVPQEYRLSWDRFIKDITQKAEKRGIPVGYNFPVGHGVLNYALPLGTKVKFDSRTGTLTFLESPVQRR